MLYDTFMDSLSCPRLSLNHSCIVNWHGCSHNLKTYKLCYCDLSVMMLHTFARLLLLYNITTKVSRAELNMHHLILTHYSLVDYFYQFTWTLFSISWRLQPIMRIPFHLRSASHQVTVLICSAFTICKIANLNMEVWRRVYVLWVWAAVSWLDPKSQLL